MAQVQLKKGDTFHLLETSSGATHYGHETPVPTAPTYPATTITRWESTEDQNVQVDFDYTVVDANNVTYPLLIGGRPKARRR
jgi:hypothetical protein